MSAAAYLMPLINTQELREFPHKRQVRDKHSPPLKMVVGVKAEVADVAMVRAGDRVKDKAAVNVADK